MGTHTSKLISTSQWRQMFFITSEKGTKRSREGVEMFSTCPQAQSIPIRQVMVRRASSWFSHPGFTSTGLYIIRTPWLKFSQSPSAGMPERCSLYLFKLVPRILLLQMGREKPESRGSLPSLGFCLPRKRVIQRRGKHVQ